ncbi:pilus assembly protein TadG-related protein [Streptomyces sp. Caat 7-52]|uniref:pilus assembly protein TadG-related protein n=1 Tax=Streptomyces sp. Caat 7-52 TaxID=2949637 RepID=UPI002035A5A0|nr:pilus assembly protein TadG-related protein [Streptomyces sp. Caat 7-52]
MTPPRRYGDAGQAFPIYITVVGGLLLLALAYFAVGQTTVNRGGAQTAADAAALAAAQARRDQLADEWVKEVLEPAKWQQIFDGSVRELPAPCRRADELASQNDARVLGCTQNGPLAYTVDVENNQPVGESVVPGTENKKSEARARAVVTPLCTFNPLPEDTESAELPLLTCGDRDWELDPEHLTELPEPQDLFGVHLADTSERRATKETK